MHAPLGTESQTHREEKRPIAARSTVDLARYLGTVALARRTIALARVHDGR
eukprot:COSAG05_NODE_1442_length_4879_cov_8.264644_7_plen_51_part_00